MKNMDEMDYKTTAESTTKGKLCLLLIPCQYWLCQIDKWIIVINEEKLKLPVQYQSLEMKENRNLYICQTNKLIVV